MSEKIKAIRGMNDILPGESNNWLFFEKLFSDLLISFGYKNIRTPIVESTSTFKRAIGEVTDIVEKEMYTWQDNNGDLLTLRPEGTAGCVRAMIEHNLPREGIQKVSTLVQCSDMKDHKKADIDNFIRLVLKYLALWHQKQMLNCL